MSFAISKLSGGTLDDRPSIIGNLEMEQSCFYIIVGCKNIKKKTTKIDIIQVDIVVKASSTSTTTVHTDLFINVVLSFNLNNKKRTTMTTTSSKNNNDNILLQQHQIETTQHQHTIKRDQNQTERVHLQRGAATIKMQPQQG